MLNFCYSTYRSVSKNLQSPLGQTSWDSLLNASSAFPKPKEDFSYFSFYTTYFWDKLNRVNEAVLSLAPNPIAQKAHLISKDLCPLFEIASSVHFIASLLIFPLFAMFENKGASAYETFLAELKEEAQEQLQKLRLENSEEALIQTLSSFLETPILQKEPTTQEEKGEFFITFTDNIEEIQAFKNEKAILLVNNFSFPLMTYVILKDLTYYPYHIKKFITENLQPLEKLLSFYFSLTNTSILAHFTQLLYGSSLLYLAYLSFLTPVLSHSILIILAGELLSVICLQSKSVQERVSPVVDALFCAYLFFTFSFSASYAVSVLGMLLKSSYGDLISTESSLSSILKGFATLVEANFKISKELQSLLSSFSEPPSMQ